MGVMSLQLRREGWSTMALWALGLLASVGLIASLAVGAAVLVHPPLFSELRPWWPPLAVIGLCSITASYWLLWARER